MTIACVETLRAISRPLGRLTREDSGAAAVWAALMMTVVLGMAGLGLDTSAWFLAKRKLQTAADNAVLESIAAKSRGGSSAEIKQAAVVGASLNGVVDGVDGSVAVNIPPLSGPNAGNSEYVEVIAQRDAPLYLASLVLGQNTMPISARAVGAIVSGGEHCLVALDKKSAAALEFTGNSSVTLNCGIASNSSSEQAILVNGSATLSADPSQAVGDILVTGSGMFDTKTPPQPYSPPVPDPFSGLSLPDPATLSCDHNNYAAKNETLSPGVYCGGLDMKFTVTLQPGVYIILDGSLSINANANITGTDVTFLFLGTTAADIGGVSNINGNANVSLSAPGVGGHASGPYAGQFPGLIFVQDPGALSAGVNRLNGGADMQFNGALYFPSQEVNYTGNSDQTNGCIKVVARKITFSGASDLNADPANCAARGVPAIRQTRQRIVE